MDFFCHPTLPDTASPRTPGTKSSGTARPEDVQSHKGPNKGPQAGPDFRHRVSGALKHVCRRVRCGTGILSGDHRHVRLPTRDVGPQWAKSWRNKPKEVSTLDSSNRRPYYEIRAEFLLETLAHIRCTQKTAQSLCHV